MPSQITGPTLFFRGGAWETAVVALAMIVGCARRADARPVPLLSPVAVPTPDAAPVVAAPTPAAATVAVPTPVVVPAPVSGLRTLDLVDIRREMRKARGHVLFVHIWASWCGPCLEELALMNQFADGARARGAVVLSISLDADRRMIARIPALLRARAPGLSATVAHFDDTEQFISLFSKSWEGTIPAMFAFDRAGRPHGSLIGEVEPADLDALMAELLPSPSPPSRLPSPSLPLPSPARSPRAQ